MVFEWDPGKAASNALKPGVTFHEAATVLGDPLSMTFPDPDHSEQEERFITIGNSDRGRLVVVAHTERSRSVRINQREARNAPGAPVL